MTNFVSDFRHEEPCEARVSRTVLWEGRGETSPPDPIVANFEQKFRIKFK